MRHLSYSTRGDPGTYFGSVRLAVIATLHTLGVTLTKEEATPVVAALLEAIQAQKLVLLPHKPTRAMVEASMSALHQGARPSVGWVDTPTKHQWRLYTALAAAPDWREGMRADAEVRAADRERQARHWGRACLKATASSIR